MFVLHVPNSVFSSLEDDCCKEGASDAPQSVECYQNSSSTKILFAPELSSSAGP